MTHLMEFIDRSPTSFHAARNLAEIADATPFKGALKTGQVYSVLKEGFLLLFKAGSKKITRTTTLAAHTDSPGFKLKPHPEVVKENLLLLSADVYGSPILTSWLNRDLGLAGRVLFENRKGQIQEELVFLDHPALIIPELAPHLKREGETAPLNLQNHFLILAGYFDPKLEGHFLEHLLKEQLPLKKLLAHDLFLVPLEKARKIGYKDPFIASPRLDNLASCHAIVEAFLKSDSKELSLAVFWDHEEIGSNTATGASSPLFLETLERITLALGLSRQEFLELKERSCTYSLDLAHATHPAYPETMEPAHAPRLGKGSVLKWSPTARYATTPLTAASLLQQPFPVQHFVIRADKKGGSTVGPLHASATGIATCDLGLPQLSMHSIREIIAEKDYLEQIELLTGLYSLS